jgi:hypothetical protein
MDDDPLHRIFAELGLPQPTDDEIGVALKLARLVAHGTERRAAPLVCYAAGLTLTAATEPTERAQRLQSLLEAARDLVGSADDG